MHDTTDAINYLSDSRVASGVAEAPILYLEDGSEVALPTTWAVCEVCEGKGTHVNPSIDAGGISAEDFHDDPEFAESYFRGDYDQPCNHCRGRTTVQAVDWDALTVSQRALWQAQLQEEANDRACHLAEIRAGA